MTKKEVSVLLSQWCNELLKTQDLSDDLSKRGGLYCPTCNLIHGRCFEAMYPFLFMAEYEKDIKWVKAAELLFDWAENNVSLEDGTFKNDIDASWRGTTVFNTLALLACLKYHSTVIPSDLKKRIEKRTHIASEALYNFDFLKNNNINYPLSNSLALYYSGKYFLEKKYLEKAEELASIFYSVISPSKLIFGEGIPRTDRTAKGCYSVDIGYNVEETIPSLLLFALETENEKMLKDLTEVAIAHLDFFLPNGGWDNSFGTRNFKWTYWGSRTSDGFALASVLLSSQDPIFSTVTNRVLDLLKYCSPKGLLSGGPNYNVAGEGDCIHHTFEHAKVLTEILDRDLSWDYSASDNLPREKIVGIKYYPEIQTWLTGNKNYTLTFTDYDWEYLEGSHASGGTISFLYHYKLGLVLCSSMRKYFLKEPRNMQIPNSKLHECLTIRIEYIAENEVFSSLYDNDAIIDVNNNIISVKGILKNINHKVNNNLDLRFEYSFIQTEDSLIFHAKANKGNFIIPIISSSDELVERIKNSISLKKKNGEVLLISDKEIILPYDKERVFNLIPGFQALKSEIALSQTDCKIQLLFSNNKGTSHDKL